jgi:hypothetical protein
MAVTPGNGPIPPHMSPILVHTRWYDWGPTNAPSKRIFFSPAMSWSKALKTVVSLLDMYCTNVLMYRTMVL